MFILKNEKSYYSYLGWSIIIPVTGIGMYIIKSEILYIYVSGIIELLVIGSKFLTEIGIDEGLTTIKYFQFFIRRKKTIQTKNVIFVLKQKGSFRSPVYYEVRILKGNKIVYNIDSKIGGWSKEELHELCDYGNGVKE